MSIETYGHYQLLKRLAMGGMAQIYLARQRGPEGFEKKVVVKRILPHLAENADFVQMFLDEARIAARLNHPNIVQIFDLGAQDDSFFIAMEYIHGEDLRRVWKRAERNGQLIPVPLVCRVIIEACAGLDYAHKKTDANGKPLGIVHRDVSPQNILLTFEGRVKVVDFGIAKAADQATVTRSGVLKGKYSYMSPEQASGEKVDRRSDIFALGVVLYELLTGTRLFKRNNDMSTLQAVADCQILPPSKVNSRVPEHLDPIVMKALTRDPGARYAEALQLQLALEDWLVAHQLPSSSAHVAAFMKDLYATRLAEEARLGDVVVEEADLSPPSGHRAVEKSSVETMAAPRQVEDTDALEERRDSTDRLERTPARTPGRSSRSESRGTSERKALEPRRTMDLRRASAPELVEEPRSSSAKPMVRQSRPRHPALPPRRKSKRLAVLGVSVGMVVGLGLGAWWALRSVPVPEAPPAPKPSTSAQTAPPRPETQPPAPVRAEAQPKKPEPVAPVVEASPPPSSPPREERKPEPARATAERPSHPESRMGSVVFVTGVDDWVQVTCGGKNLGTFPNPPVPLPVGTYQCKVSNPEKQFERSLTVNVKASTQTRVPVKF